MENTEAVNSQLNLVALEGSEKQIAWAESLRAKWVEASAHRAHILTLDKVDYHGLCRLSRYRRQILSHTSASWWIDHRDIKTLCEYLVDKSYEHLDDVRGEVDSIRIRKEQDAIDLTTPDGDFYCYRRYHCADLQVHLHLTGSAPDEGGEAVVAAYLKLQPPQIGDSLTLEKYVVIGRKLPDGIPDKLLNLLEHGSMVIIDADDQDAVQLSILDQVNNIEGLSASLAVLQASGS